MHFFSKINEIDFPCSEHMALLMIKYPHHENDQEWLKHKQNETFAKWFQKKVLYIIFCVIYSNYRTYSIV